MPAIINSDSGIITGSAGLKIYGNSDGVLEIQNNGVTSLVVANSYIKVPVGNTATRPSVASAGMLRFNNQSNVFEVHNGVGWVSANFSSNSFVLEYLVVAGGGAGGSNDLAGGGGGGGAGGVLRGNTIITSSSISSFSITAMVGGGGAASPTIPQSANPPTTRGSNSLLSLGSNAFVTFGGGGGGFYDPSGVGFNAWPGGSGGGGATRASVTWYGDGVPGQGFPGGFNTGAPVATPQAGAGGGGAGQKGANISGPALAGPGGNGIVWLNGVTYAGGGGGGQGGTGGFGGGGAAYPSPLRNGNVNTGGGGGAGFNPAGGGGGGGSGIILLMHPSAFTNAIVSAGLVYSVNTQVSPGNTLYEITAGIGTLTWR